jgi:type I restriction enzyme M protein
MFQQTFKNIDDVLWKEAGCTTELDYTEQTSWMLFLKYLECNRHLLPAEVLFQDRDRDFIMSLNRLRINSTHIHPMYGSSPPGG